MTEIMPKEKSITYTYTSPKGVVVVVTNVPALVVDFENVPEEVMYKPDISKRLNRIVREQLKLNVIPGVYHVHFDKYALGVSVDMAVHMTGPGVSYGDATTKTWKDAIDRIHNSWITLKKGYAKFFDTSQIESPVITAVRPGSLEFDLQATKPLPLFTEMTEDSPHEFKILQLLIDGYDLAVKGQSNNELLKVPEIAIAALEAVERLSPKDSTLIEVELIPNGQTLNRKASVSLTGDTYQRARDRRQEIQLSLVDEDSRQVKIIGQIWTFDRTGELTIKEIELNEPGVTLYNTRAKFDSTDDDLYEQLADHMKYKKRVLFKGIEHRVNGSWSSDPEIKTAEEAPPRTEVEKMRT